MSNLPIEFIIHVMFGYVNLVMFVWMIMKRMSAVIAVQHQSEFYINLVMFVWMIMNRMWMAIAVQHMIISFDSVPQNYNEHSNDIIPKEDTRRQVIFCVLNGDFQYMFPYHNIY